METVASVQPRVLGAFAPTARRAAFVAALALAVALPRPRMNPFDFPAIDHAWTLLPFAALMLIPFAEARRRARLLQLDLLVLLSFLVALSQVGPQRPWSLMLPYAPLLYLAVRMLAHARSGAPASLHLHLPRAWLLGAIAVLCVVHVSWALETAVPTDIGIDSVTGALNVIHGRPLYATAPGTDTYGPLNFEAYVPFAAAFSSANAAARAATLFFTLLTGLLMFLLGRQVRGPDAGVALAFCWLALPFTLYEDAMGFNDPLVAAALVGTLLLARMPARRGAMAALAAWTKLAPLALVPLLATRASGTGRRAALRDFAFFCVAFAGVSALVFIPALAHDTPATFISRSFGYQSSRPPADSLWAALQDSYALHAAWVGTLSRVLHGLAMAVAVATAIVLPRARLRQDVAALAAGSAAVLMLLAFALNYFAYSYILWFAPLVLIAAVLAPARPATVQVDNASSEERCRNRPVKTHSSSSSSPSGARRWAWRTRWPSSSPRTSSPRPPMY
jgi:hypothetical protein